METPNNLQGRLTELIMEIFWICEHPVVKLETRQYNQIYSHVYDVLDEHLAKAEPLPGDVESLAKRFHEIYQAEAQRQRDVRHPGTYESLSEAIKEYDRVLARAVLVDRVKVEAERDILLKQLDIEAFEHGITKAERDALRDRVEVLAGGYRHLGEVAMSCLEQNTPEWMNYLKKTIDQADAVLTEAALATKTEDYHDKG